ncbi:MAG: LysR family transcriptional regulator [Pseudomonadota bacterium]
MSTNASLRGLRTFCLAAKHESFSDAADELFITPSAVSHQIKGLEEELGQRLFDRNARELRLTGAGRSLHLELQTLIEQIDEVVSAVKNQTRRTSLRMSVQPFFASEYFVPRLGEFTQRHPDIDIQVGASDESAESRAGDSDLSIRLHSAPPVGVNSQLLFPLRLVVAGSKAMRDSLKVRNGLIESEFPLLVHESLPRTWKQWSKSSGIAIPAGAKVTRLDSMIAVVRAVEQGLGAGLVPVPIANQWFEQETIFQLFDKELLADLQYYLIWTDDRAAKGAVGVLKSWVLERFRGIA